MVGHERFRDHVYWSGMLGKESPGTTLAEIPEVTEKLGIILNS
jgi:hypothetical protein